MSSAKKLIIFSFEGKNNKTESLYFRHFIPCDENFILKTFSSGCTDVKNMINSSKRKAACLGFTAKDLLYIFIDADCDKSKIELIKKYRAKLPKNIKLIVSNPCFEIWFIYHFAKFNKPIHSNEELLNNLTKFIPNYQKNKDYFDLLKDKCKVAIENIKNVKEANSLYYSEVYSLFDEDLIKFK